MNSPEQTTDAADNTVPVSSNYDNQDPNKSNHTKFNSIIETLIANTLLMMHGVIDFIDGAIILGFRVMQNSADGAQEHIIHIIGDKNGYDLKKNCDKISINGKQYIVKKNSKPPLINEKWGLQELKNFLTNPSCLPNMLQQFMAAIKNYVELKDTYEYTIVSLWIIATYFTHLFNAFPFLHLLGPKENGKSTLLEIILYTAFNCDKVKTITEAAVADRMDSERQTLLIDQAEKIPRALVGFFADSYKKQGAKRSIVGTKNGERIIREFSGYGAKAFAAIRELDDDLQDRCIQINMLKTKKSLPNLSGTEAIWLELRGSCYRILLSKHAKVKEMYDAIPGNGTRKMELWRPLEAVARALEMPEAEIVETKKAFMKLIAKTQAKLSPIETALFLSLKDFTEEDGLSFEKTPSEILKGMEKYINKKDTPNSQWIGKKLSLYSLVDENDKNKDTTGAKLMHYMFNTKKVTDVINRYL